MGWVGARGGKRKFAVLVTNDSIAEHLGSQYFLYLHHACGYVGFLLI